MRVGYPARFRIRSSALPEVGWLSLRDVTASHESWIRSLKSTAGGCDHLAVETCSDHEIMKVHPMSLQN